MVIAVGRHFMPCIVAMVKVLAVLQQHENYMHAVFQYTYKLRCGSGQEQKQLQCYASFTFARVEKCIFDVL